MTWKELKEFVDKRLAEEGVCEDIKIEHMDFSYPAPGIINVYVDKDSNVMEIH